MLCQETSKSRVVLVGAFTQSGVEIGAQVSQTVLRGILVVFPEAGKGPQNRRDKFSNDFHLFGGRSRYLRHKKIAKGATSGCSGTSDFFAESKNCVLKVVAAAVESLHLIRQKVCPKRARRAVQNSSSRGALYNVGDGNNASPRATISCQSFLQTQMTASQHSSLEMRQMERMAIGNSWPFFVLSGTIIG